MPFHGFRGNRKARQANKSAGFSQASMRHDVTTYDQDGRAYTFSAENNTGMPCTIVSPKFSAPWLPDPQYILVNPDNVSECFCDYRAVITDRMQAMREYHRRAVRKADKSGWPAPKLGEYSDDIIASCGQPPRPYQLAVAAEQGNPWILGKSKRPDPRLVKYLELETASTDVDDTLEEFDFSANTYSGALSGLRDAVRQQQAAGERDVIAEELEQLEQSEENPFTEGLEAAAAGADEDEGPELVDDLEPEFPEEQPLEDEPSDAELLEEFHDSDAIGGKTVKTTDRRRSGPGRQRARTFQRNGRRSMADGAAPVIAG
jgi:hypothetical protein